LAVTLQEADQGDTTTVLETLAEAGEQVAELIGTEEPSRKPQVHLKGIEEMVGDKGYHSGRVKPMNLCDWIVSLRVKFWPVHEQYSAEFGKINDTRTAVIKEYWRRV
jgi:hypothetical protein